jgi:hypothetical protein
MSNKNKSAQGAKEVTPAQEQTPKSGNTQQPTPATEKTDEQIKSLIHSAGLEQEPQFSPWPRMTLAEREKAIRENSEKLRGLTNLRAELDALRSWGFADNGTNATLKISGEDTFTTSNTRLISKLKNYLEDLFEERIHEIEEEINTAQI